MILPEDDIEPPGPGAVVLGEPGVPEAIGAARPVFSPCQGERDALAPELAVDEGPVGDRALLGWRRRRSPIQALLEEVVQVAVTPRDGMGRSLSRVAGEAAGAG